MKIENIHRKTEAQIRKEIKLLKIDSEGNELDRTSSAYISTQAMLHSTPQTQSYEDKRNNSSELSHFLKTELGENDFEPIAIWLEPKIDIDDRPDLNTINPTTPLEQ